MGHLILVLAVLAAPQQPPPPSRVLHVWPLVPALAPLPPAPVARGVFYRRSLSLVLPPLGPGQHYVLSSSPDGRRPLWTDDLLLLSVAGRHAGRFALRFGQPDGSGVISRPPVDVSSLLPSGRVSLALSLVDLIPPVCSSEPVYLSLLAPPRPARSTAAPSPSRQSSGRRAHHSGTASSPPTRIRSSRPPLPRKASGGDGIRLWQLLELGGLAVLAVVASFLVERVMTRGLNRVALAGVASSLAHQASPDSDPFAVDDAEQSSV